MTQVQVGLKYRERVTLAKLRAVEVAQRENNCLERQMPWVWFQAERAGARNTVEERKQLQILQLKSLYSIFSCSTNVLRDSDVHKIKMNANLVIEFFG